MSHPARAPVLQVAEPPAPYLARPPLVVDCSAIAGMVFREHWEDQARLRIAGHTLHAPHLLMNEIASVTLQKLRRGEAHAAAGLAEVARLDIELHPTDPPSVIELAQRYQLSAYDAAYLWLAADLRCPLATFDDRLAAAAREHLSQLE
ncbi:type II toxin-antitoxin system VapC family toxin [Xylophilus sp.]|uniref:type II toxin-antitoxin system VapC family toxin n=1 Tax=Xylophilus sp. TaxID=2653893 RepID=UPI0013BB10DD|nr:type II toxin-antitoxin system VapC family toxin [Xylophilus sp.]KAF1050307.1 MAG: Ribonuclease VapC9 [Xylophilus sp.]